MSKESENYDVEKVLTAQNRISEITATLSMSVLDKLEHAYRVAKEQADNYLTGYGKGSESNLSGSNRAEYNALKAEAEQRRIEALERARQETALKVEREELQAALYAGQIKADATAVLSLQADVVEIEKQLTELKRVLLSKQEEIKQARAENSTLVDLRRNRENLLADISLGVVVEKPALPALEKQIAEEEKRAAELNKAAEQTAAVVSGIERKIAEAEKVLAHKKTKLQQAHSDFLLAETELTAAEYIRLSDMLSKQFARLAVLGELVEKQPAFATKGILSWQCRAFKIPAFNLNACTQASKDGYLYTYEGLDLDGAARAIKSEMEAMGLVV